MLIRIKILNKHHGHKPDGDRRIYIGRGSPLGNPYRIGTYGDRATCIAAYRNYLTQCIAEKHFDICNLLNEIAHKAIHGGVDLICYCTPHACHGDVIKEIITEALTRTNHGKDIQDRSTIQCSSEGETSGNQVH